MLKRVVVAIACLLSLPAFGYDRSWVSAALGPLMQIQYVPPSTSVSGNNAWTGTNSFIDGSFSIIGSSDATKILKFEVDGFTTGNTRTITPPNSNTSLPIISQTLTFSGPTAARTYTLHDVASRVPAVVCSATPSQATTGTAEEVLATCSLAAGLVATDGMGIAVSLQFVTANNTNGKQLRIRLGGIGGTVVFDTGNQTGATVQQKAFLGSDIQVWRASATTANGIGQVSNVPIATAGAATATYGVSLAAAAVTWANALDLVITGQTPTALGDMTLLSYTVTLY